MIIITFLFRYVLGEQSAFFDFIIQKDEFYVLHL